MHTTGWSPRRSDRPRNATRTVTRVENALSNLTVLNSHTNPTAHGECGKKAFCGDQNDRGPEHVAD